MSQVNQNNDTNNAHVDVKDTVTVHELTAKTSVRTNIANCNILRITNSLTAGTIPESQTIVETDSWDVLDTVEIEENLDNVDVFMETGTYFSNGRFVYLQIPFYIYITDGEGPMTPASFTFEIPVNPSGDTFASATQAVGFYSDFTPLYAHANAVEGTNKIRVTVDQSGTLEAYVIMRIVYKI